MESGQSEEPQAAGELLPEEAEQDGDLAYQVRRLLANPGASCH